MTVVFAFSDLLNSITTLDVISLVFLVMLGIMIIMFIRFFLMLIPAVLLALVVWFFTGSLFWAGIAFLVIAALSVLKKL